MNRRPALRVDDPGIHAACCAANTWTATKGSLTVFINGKGAHRMGDQTRHCGGMGQLAEGSPNVIVGESGGGGDKPEQSRPEWIIEVEKEPDGRRIDEVQLQCERGGYNETVRREAAHDGGSHWRFGFPRGPEGTYRVDIVSGGKRYCVWKGLPLPTEHEDSSPPEPPPAESPSADVIHIEGCAQDSAA